MLLMVGVEAKDDIEALWCHARSVVVRRVFSSRVVFASLWDIQLLKFTKLQTHI